MSAKLVHQRLELGLSYKSEMKIEVKKEKPKMRKIKLVSNLIKIIAVTILVITNAQTENPTFSFPIIN